MLDRRAEIVKTLRATQVVLRALVEGARVRRMLADQGPELAPFDQEALAEQSRYLELDLEGS
jgi:hypothetical protein